MKPLTLILCVIAILGSVASTFFFFQIGTAKEQLQQEVALAATQATQLQGKITGAAAQSDALEKRLAALDNELGDAKSKASTADARSTQLGREATQLRTQLTAKTEAAQALTTELSQLKQELAQIKLTAATTAAEQSEEYKATIANLQARITDLIAINTKANARGGKSLPGVNADTAPGAAAPTPLVVEDANGFQVVSIGADNGFVVIKAGSAQGIQPKQNLVISRSGKVLATAVVSSSQENYAIAQIVTDSLKGNLSKGDLATFAQ
ncbi:MAG: hypothetical protein H2172_06500 [Opitutus sp.]|nr:hypothetical protein [Opitutus sp.]MCS6248329.1 hypothetical protein [Opitutus sp.]MCS6273571.1 hypothetical protein [Opitutus sp.]MCS6278563.1 hypothetical protein [Opitutus sp.]MCS6300035.1 hypothetical protein [Opitutus sp.]